MTYKYLYFSISVKWLKLHPDYRGGILCFYLYRNILLYWEMVVDW